MTHETLVMRKIGIVGGGFSGMMTAVHLIRNTKEPIHIFIFEPSGIIGKGIAYNTYSKVHLLNVITEKMSAFKEEPLHFLDWVTRQADYETIDRNILAISFLPRYLYGNYLASIWDEATTLAQQKKVEVTVIPNLVIDIDKTNDTIRLYPEQQASIDVEECIIATGNQLPGNLKIENTTFYSSPLYFQNSWHQSAVNHLNESLPVFIIGNGLTMVDTIIGLLENHFSNNIIALSTHGYNILPHRHTGVKYASLVDELPKDIDLYSIVALLNKHLKKIQRFGLTPEPIIDSLRPFTQKIWMGLKHEEKKTFMHRLRHLWGLARHRIPQHVQDRILDLRLNQKLFIYAGKLQNIAALDGEVWVDFYDKKEKISKKFKVGRVINCTGPETNLEKTNNRFLQQALQKGMLKQDDLKLGIDADPITFEVRDQSDRLQSNLYTLGGNLKGVLWESTAVNELRDQALALANHILNKKIGSSL
jgi:uncharacterized NAD(P)/FAD-binding protein YdhS